MPRPTGQHCSAPSTPPAPARFDVLLVYRVDRLSRSIRGLSDILASLDDTGVAFRSATEPFDTTTPAGRAMVQMLAVFAEFERATIIDRYRVSDVRTLARLAGGSVRQVRVA